MQHCTPHNSWREEFIPLDQDSPFEQYSRALYWSMTTITTIGYGDVTPIRVGEILFTIMAEFIGILIFALLVDKVVQLSQGTQIALEFVVAQV